LKNHSVLFVCSANICRSPLAAGLMMAKIGQEDAGWRIESAGTWAPEGEPAAVNTLLALARRGIDFRMHRARGVTRELLESFQLILTMERNHKEAIQAEFPNIARRVFLLSEMIDQNFNISDPMGSPSAEFESTARDLDQILSKGWDKIEQLSLES
jgi:protein arginine phosphatase